MKRAIAIAAAVLVASLASVAHASERQLTILFTGGNEANSIHIELSADGRSYLIESNAPLEVGGSVCSHPGEQVEDLVCEAAAITGFEFNAGGGNDVAVVGANVMAPVTLRGGPGDDRLVGGGGNDKLIGGAGDDVLVGRGGDDWLYGGPGNDKLYGGPGNDVLRGGPGENVLVGGPGVNEIS